LKCKVASKLVHSAVPLTFNKKEQEERGKPKFPVKENLVTIQIVPPKLAFCISGKRENNTKVLTKIYSKI